VKHIEPEIRKAVKKIANKALRSSFSSEHMIFAKDAVSQRIETNSELNHVVLSVIEVLINSQNLL
jgi:hypothetical protein